MQTRSEIIRQLESRLGSTGLPAPSRVFPTGIEPLDDLLPAGGLESGCLVEWLTESEASGAETLWLLAAARLLDSSGIVVVLDGEKTFHCPSAIGWGIDLDRLVLIRPGNDADALWATEQALRCPGVSLVFSRWDRIESRVYRRLKLAAEKGPSIGLLLRPSHRSAEPSWADVRLRVQAAPSSKSEPSPVRRLRLELLRHRKGTGGKTVELELDHETGFVRPLSSLAAPAPIHRAAEA